MTKKLLKAGSLAALAALVALSGLGLVENVAAQSFPGYPAAWIDQVCPGTDPRGPYVKCWVALPRFATAVEDPIASLDQSHKSNPQPRGADIYAGEQANQNSIFYAYDPDADVVMFRKRLDGTPTLGVNGGSSPPGTDANGPFLSNTAWNFVMDFNGDGWGDIVGATDGNTGKQQDPGDTIQLGYANTPGSQEIIVLGNGGSFDPTKDLCSVGGRFLFRRKANTVPPVPGCPTQLSPNCDFIFTRTLNVCPPTNPAGCTTDDANFFLDMQFPRQAFDNCTAPDVDSDGIGGDQILYPTTRFTLCVTTSTQPNDFTNKDLALKDAYIMGKDKPLPCSDQCTLMNGCSQPPELVDMGVSCGTGVNNNPITLTAHVFDTAGLVGGVVTDSIDNVEFLYIQEDGSGGTVGSYTRAAPVSGSSNPVTSPGSQINLWSMQWKTDLLPTSPSSLYRIRVVITDDQGNVRTFDPKTVDIAAAGCSVTNTPVTLAYFNSIERADGGVDLEWETATETENAGFNLYAATAQGWLKLNSNPISSSAVDSSEPQSYRFESPAGVDAHGYIIEDIDLSGVTKLRGPFKRGNQYGSRVEVRRVDWAEVHEETARRKASSKALVRKGYRMAVSSDVSSGGKTSKKAGYPEVVLSVSEDGLHRVTYEDLLSAGFDFSGALANEVALERQGQPVPVRVGGGARFGPGSYIEFHGQAANTLYTNTMPHRLSVNREKAKAVLVDRKNAKKRGSSPAFYMEAAKVENNLRHNIASPTHDPWYDVPLVTSGNTPFSHSMDLEVRDLASVDHPASVWVDLYGMTQLPANPDHHVILKLNGVPLAESFFDNREVKLISAQVPRGLLREGVNQLTVEMPAVLGLVFDWVYLNSYGVTYPRALKAKNGELDFQAAGDAIRVQNLPSPEAVVYRVLPGGAEWIEKVDVAPEGAGWSLTFHGGTESAAYAVSTVNALKKPGISAARSPVDIGNGRAEYLIISHANFLDALSPLVAAREAQGLSVRVVDVEDVYERFAYGLFDANAIRAFVAHAARYMGTRHVLLVGADTYDYKDYLGYGSVSLIPSLYAPTGASSQSATGSIVKFAPVDPLYADVDGDQVPDLSIGRFPVRTSSQLSILIEKTLRYASKSYGRTGVFASDAAEEDLPFGAQSDYLSRGLGQDWDIRKAYIDLIGLDRARSSLIESVNQGVALTSFIGHSGPTLWSFKRLFTAADALNLDNVGKPTVVMQWGCFNNYHVQPSFDTLGHNFLLQPQGAAAVLGSSTLSKSDSAQALSRELAGLLAQPGLALGEAVRIAKQRLAAVRPELSDVILGWTILGDPALVIDPGN